MFGERNIIPQAASRIATIRPENSENFSLIPKETSTKTDKIAGVFLVGLGTALLFVGIHELTEKHYLAAGITLIIGGVCLKKGIDLFTGKKKS